ncbi:MAG: 50S ribosomal protein L9 [Desulfobulbaceae bacterium]|nr:MAG: 50S ribosomal protein L9 [Desulfobulbaceae bacterium]
MELILKETIDSLGREGDVVKVKPGYGRNYLLPQGKAVVASQDNLQALEENRAAIQARLDEERKQAEQLSKKLTGINLEFAQLVGEDDKLFGSVTVSDIAEKLAENKIEVEKRSILLSEPIKTLGETSVVIKVGFEMNTEIKVTVVPQESE